jgi:hypothetical protein
MNLSSSTHTKPLKPASVVTVRPDWPPPFVVGRTASKATTMAVNKVLTERFVK